jgi:hypothetical protein
MTIICTPIFIYHQINTIKNNDWLHRKKIILITQLALLAIVIYTAKLAYQYHEISYALKSMQEFLLFEKSEILYPLLASIYVALLFFSEKAREEFHYITFAILVLIFAGLLPYSNLIKNYESWQIHQTFKNFFFMIGIAYAAKLILQEGSQDQKMNLKKAVFVGLGIVTAIISLQNFRYLYGYNRQFYYACSKRDLALTEHLLENNECIGTYNIYEKDLPRLEYFTQRSSFTYELYYSSFFKEKQVWLCNINLHPRLDSLQDVLQSNWQRSLFYQYNKLHQSFKKEDAVIDFLHQYRIKHIITNCRKSALPKVLVQKLLWQQSFTVDNKTYSLYKVIAT